jgi:protein ImuB
MGRVISLFLPTWPTDRLRRKLGAEALPSDTPFILVGRGGQRRVVFAANGAASALGLRAGMTATKAQALVPGLVIKDADPVGDRDGLERLAVWALQRYAPIVAADPPDGLIIDATGAAHLHGGEKAMVADIVSRITSSGISGCAAMADSWGAAHALARHASRRTIVIPEGKSARAIMLLPIAALRLPADLVSSLLRLGFETIEDLVSKPRGPLHREVLPQQAVGVLV